MASLYALVDGVELEVTQASVTWAQGEVGKADFTVLQRDAMTIPDIVYADWSLIRNGQPVMTGIILDQPTLQIQDTRNLTLRIAAVDELGRLTCERAVSDAHFQDVDLITMLNFLLAGAPNYALGNVSTLVNPAARTTLDLRNKETLYAQLAEAAKGFPRTFLRYGGRDSTGRYLIDAGYFGSETSILGQHDNLASLTQEKTSRRQYKFVEAYGGRSRTTRPTLCDAINATLSPTVAARTFADPNYAIYPIVNVGGKCMVNNTNIERGCSVTKEFTVNKTENATAPTDEERAEAAYAVYQKAVRFLQESQGYIIYRGGGYYQSPPQISDNVYVQALVSETAYDPLTMQSVTYRTFEAAGSYRITKLSTTFAASSFRETDAATAGEVEYDLYELEVTDNDYAQVDDEAVALYEQLNRPDVGDAEVETALAIKRVDAITVTHLATTPADAACLPAVAKQFVFAPPAPPANATQLFGTIVSVTPVAASANVVQYPVYPSTSMILCVTDGSVAGWGTSTVSITVRFDWI